MSAPQSVDASNVGEGQASDTNVLEDIQGGIKRKLDSDDGEGKRARQKTGGFLFFLFSASHSNRCQVRSYLTLIRWACVHFWLVCFC